MTVAVALAAAQQKVGRIAHAFLAAGDDDVRTFGLDEVMGQHDGLQARAADLVQGAAWDADGQRSEEHTSELQSLMRISYAVFCLKKKNTQSNDKQKDSL